MSERFKVDVPEGRSGKWVVSQFTVENGIGLMRLQMSGRHGPKVGETYTRLMRDKAWDPMMSDTPDEIRDAYEALHMFKKPEAERILINGLGLGVVLKMALEQPHVKHVDVVEIEPDIITLVAPSYTDPRIHIHEADAYTIEWPKGMAWDVAWHDIWPSICTDNLEGMGKLHRKYGRRVQEQNSWMRGYLQSQRRRERYSGW